MSSSGRRGEGYVTRASIGKRAVGIELKGLLFCLSLWGLCRMVRLHQVLAMWVQFYPTTPPPPPTESERARKKVFNKSITVDENAPVLEAGIHHTLSVVGAAECFHTILYIPFLVQRNCFTATTYRGMKGFSQPN